MPNLIHPSTYHLGTTSNKSKQKQTKQPPQTHHSTKESFIKQMKAEQASKHHMMLHPLCPLSTRISCMHVNQASHQHRKPKQMQAPNKNNPRRRKSASAYHQSRVPPFNPLSSMQSGPILHSSPTTLTPIQQCKPSRISDRKFSKKR